MKEFKGDSIIEITESKLKKPTNKFSATSANYDFFDLNNFPINIVAKENATGNRYLTSNGLNNVLTYQQKNNAESQLFYLQTQPLTGYLAIYSKVNGVNKLVSAGAYVNNPTKNVLYVKDGTSSMGAMWDFLKGTYDNESFALQNADLLEQGPGGFWDVYNLVLGSNGTEVVFGKNNDLGTQQFSIVPNDIFTLESIEYLIDETGILENAPDFIVTWDLSNANSTVLNAQAIFTEKASYESTFSNTSGITYTTNAEVNTGISTPVFSFGGKISTSTARNISFSLGEKKVVEDTRQYNLAVAINPMTHVYITHTVNRFNIRVNYKATLIGNNTGKKVTMYGEWNGVDYTDMSTDIKSVDLQTGKVTIQKNLNMEQLRAKRFTF